MNSLREYLDLIQRGPNRPARLFDIDWYVRRYPEVRRHGRNPLQHYLRHGGNAGFQPHPLFDGKRYLRLNPDVAAAGINPLVHYLRFGWREGRSPHPLFDGVRYLQLYQDVAASGLNPLLHYLQFGWREGRSPHPLFDSEWYLTEYPEVPAGAVNPLLDYVGDGASEGRDPHPLFNTDWYLKNYPELRLRRSQALAHYLEVGGLEGRNPGPIFDSAWYLDTYPDVARQGLNPLVHYLDIGSKEGRFPFDPHVDSHNARADALVQLTTRRYSVGRPAIALVDFLATTFDQACTERIKNYFAKYGLPQSGERRISPPSPEELAAWIEDLNKLQKPTAPSANPDVSIVIPVFNELAHTLACIHSLLEMNSKRTFEVIVGDDASIDATPATLKLLPWVKSVRSETNRGFIANCNAAAAVAQGRYVAFLNNDTIVLPGWLDELVDTVERDPNIGLAGSKLIFADGRLQEAGGIIWRDGSAWNYGRGEDPNHPEFSYLRDVDYVSGASIMLPAALWRELRGFDDWYDVAYAEDCDLAFRVRQSGRRVVLQPLSMLLHFEGVTSGTDTRKGVKAYQISNGKKLFERWSSVLASHRLPGDRPDLERERNVQRRILVMDAVTPRLDQDAGSVACFELMRAFQAIGFKVSFLPWSNLFFDGPHTKALQRIGIEAIYHPYFRSLEHYFRNNGGLFDIVLAFRNEVAFSTLNFISRYAPNAKIIFHVADLHFLREARKFELERLSSSDRRIRQIQAQEIYSATASDLTVVHSFYEKDVLAKHAPDSRVYVFPWIVDTKPVAGAFDKRSGIAFIGGYGHPPNVDAVLYFAEKIWPKIYATRRDIIFYVYGSNAPPEIKRLDGKKNIRIVGYIENLDDCFNNIRVSIAPLRYGAGLKGKVATAMAYGVPVVATSCAAEGMALTDGVNILVRDNEDEFARAVLQLYEDEAIWNRISTASISYVDESFSTRKGIERVREIVDLLNKEVVALNSQSGLTNRFL